MKILKILPWLYFLTGCGLANYDDVAYRQVIVTDPPRNQIQWLKNKESTDVSCNRRYWY